MAASPEPAPPLPGPESHSHQLGKELTNPIGMKLTLIPAGEFLMGSPDCDTDARDGEQPQHHVRITRPYFLGVHQVTRGQFGQFVRATCYRTYAEKNANGGWGWDESAGRLAQDPKFTWRSIGLDTTDLDPVVNVNWNDALAFCDWLSKQEGQQYRLPTEAEWEYACRAGTTTAFSFGDDVSLLDQYAWYCANSDGQTQPVGQKKPNAWGLHDIHGNVCEWCSDWFDVDYYKPFQQTPAIDPQGPEQGEFRVVRGGSWFNVPQNGRSAFRYSHEPDDLFLDMGFRVALSGRS